MKPMTMYASPVCGQAQNTHYPHQHVVASLDDLKSVVAFDHVVAEYEGGQRGNSRFLTSDCLVMDVDNDHSETPTEWVTPSRLADLIPGVSFMAATSRNHMKPKGASSARPRFHVYLPINTATDAEAYAALKRQLAAQVPVFDSNALDAGRFIYGNPDAKATAIEGESLVDEWLARDLFAEFDQASSLIGEGSRNATLSRFAGRVLIRYGNTERARELFNQKAALCDPPLPSFEVEQIWGSATRFAKHVSSQEGYVPPEEYAGESVKPSDFSDVCQAQLLARDYADRVRYSEGTEWVAYNGSFWEESVPKAQFAAQQLTQRQLDEALLATEDAREKMVSTGAWELLAAMGKAKALRSFNPAQAAAFEAWEDAQAFYKYAVKRRESRAITACLREAHPLLYITPTELDAKPFLLNTPGGTYDLREGLSSHRAHDPADLLMKQTTVDPSDDGVQVWQAALDAFFQGDQELIDYVQRIVGLAAFGKVMVEALIIAYGDGRNGKSTFWNVISRVLGSYSGNLSADALTVGSRRNVKPELAEIKGKRFLIAAELEEGMRLNTSTVKQLCSTDEIYAEKKFKAPFAYTPSHTLVLYTNHLPRVGAMDAGIWRRLIVIPFQARIEGNQDIKNYADHLYNHAGGAILSWIIEGARLIHAEGFHLRPPRAVQEACEAYREENDWFSHFLEECCQKGDGEQERSGELYRRYRAWALETSGYARPTTDFYREVERAGFTRSRTNKGVIIKGLTLKDEPIWPGEPSD
ncbi:primase C-terminal domain-containing protein [Canibacter sp. lx-72]|uniref:phage/plasmid primase, P4 family n=1 Tax=Canibacter zhuwentaonis TaxID=2837491 RepID=UPI001BDCD233|nr:phage/plasmid primase, P4 family [Canibacter zhuwentaonis]MBT1017585.1 primase C-terminal domain-containing protein [Canibacter zhuwentaonis]